MAGGSCDLLIFDMLIGQTVGRFIWLNPIAMCIVNCIRAEVVECSGLKPCWYGARRIHLLMVGRVRVSRNFAVGQRSEMGRYEDPWEVFLPGFGIRMINDDFHIAGI